MSVPLPYNPWHGVLSPWRPFVIRQWCQEADESEEAQITNVPMFYGQSVTREADDTAAATQNRSLIRQAKSAANKNSKVGMYLGNTVAKHVHASHNYRHWVCGGHLYGQ